ncbi:type II toxin-antitoxin system RelE/ParE family toxin [Sphingopyxis sp.]|uniref:type II toxin-antitoxin system RelE family toxin n=1 Tax=Sphingopyxis sp. TaxID=1908224 RepID=UPI0035B43B12
MTTYRLTFLRDAKKEWDKLASPLRKQLEKKLRERLDTPRVEADRLHGLPDCYKIKLRSAGYRLVYRVFDDRIVVQIVAIGKCERNEAYERAARRL